MYYSFRPCSDRLSLRAPKYMAPSFVIRSGSPDIVQCVSELRGVRDRNCREDGYVVETLIEMRAGKPILGTQRVDEVQPFR